MSNEKLPFICPNCGRNFGWGDGSAPIFLGIVNTIPFNNEPTPCCGHKISGYITRDLEMVLKDSNSTEQLAVALPQKGA